MIDLLTFARLLSGGCWLLCASLQARSFVRACVGSGLLHDKVWAIFFLIAVHQLIYSLRWVLGLAYDPVTHHDYYAVCGQHVFTSMIAITVIGQRRLIEGGWW